MSESEFTPENRPVDVYLDLLRVRMDTEDYRLLLRLVEPVLEAIDEHRLSGLDLAERVRDKYPSIRIVLTSGYSAELIGRDKVDGLGLKVLRKPYRQAQLALILREALDAGSAR